MGDEAEALQDQSEEGSEPSEEDIERSLRTKYKGKKLRTCGNCDRKLTPEMDVRQDPTFRGELLCWDCYDEITTIQSESFDTF